MDALVAQVAELDGSEPDWRQLVETLPQIVWVTRPDGWHEHYNRQWFDYTGRSWEESLGDGWNPAFHPGDRPRAAAEWERATSQGEPYEIEYRLRRCDGVYRWMLGRALPLRDSDGRIVKWFGTCTDIDDLKGAQAELEQSRTLHRMAGSMARLAGWSIEVPGREIRWSEEIFEILEYPPGEPPSLETATALYRPSSRQPLRDAIERCATAGEPFDLELEIETYTGRHLWVRVMGEASYTDDGAVSQVHGAFQDISVLKASSARSDELAERLTTTLESITDAFYTLDRDWCFTYVNGRAEQLLHRNRSELLGQGYFDKFAAIRGTELEDALLRAMRDEVTTTLDGFHFPGLASWFQVNIYPSPQGLAVYFRDVSGQHHAQEALQERVKEMDALIQISSAAHEQSGVRQLCELTADALIAALRYPERSAVRVSLGDVRIQRGPTEDAVEVFDLPITVAGRRDGHIRVADRDGEPLLAEEGALVQAIARTLGLWRGRHHATRSLKQLNQDLHTANQDLENAAELKDDLLSMASHELRTPLTPILGFIELFEHQAEHLTPTQQTMLDSMRNNARRMLRLVDDLLVATRADADGLVSRPEPVELQGALQLALDDLGELLPEVDLDLHDPTTVLVDRQHLHQIIINLLTNAAKYGTPPITVRTHADRPGRVAIEVIDHGEGVPEASRTRMWERYTQKDQGDRRTATGTGLGLAIVRLLTEIDDGTVSYRPNTPTGAIFTVELPTARERGPTRSAASTHSPRHC